MCYTLGMLGMRAALTVALFTLTTVTSIAATSIGPLDQAVAYQHDASHAGFSSGPVPPLRRLWSLHLDGGLLTYPLIADRRVFISSTTSVIALDAASGRTLWVRRFSPENVGWSGIAYDRGVIFATYIASTSDSPAGVFAFDAQSGRQIWSAPFLTSLSFAYPPVASNGILYYSGAGGGTAIVALSEQTGATLWYAGITQPEIPAVTGAATVVTSTGCFSASAFGALSGTLLWQVPIGCSGVAGLPTPNMPVNSGALTYVRGGAQSPDNGTILSSLGGVVGSYSSQFIPAAGAGHIFLLPAPNLITAPQTLIATNPLATSINWEVSLVGDVVVTPPIVVTGPFRGPAPNALTRTTVYIETAAGRLNAYNAAKGTLLMSLPLGVAGASFGGSTGLAAAGNILIVPTDHQLLAFTSAPALP